jgi:formate hydrogenlyase subunit 3/multisubunit Na+/H+ antiporter MnhD subunit
MNLVSTGLVALPVVAGLAVAAGASLPARNRSAVAGALSIALGLTAVVTGAAAMSGTVGEAGAEVPFLPTAAALTLSPDRVGGLFMIVAGAVGALTAGFGIGYSRGPSASRTAWAAYPVFVLGMTIVPAAGDVISFLLAWELMAIGSTVLLVAEHASREKVRSAALWYGVMTHLSFLLLLAGFAILAAAASSTDLGAIARHSLVGVPASVAFLLLIAGFVTKAGAVPVHVWLPRAHPEAPSHVSATMSAAMVKMGVYGVLLVVLRLLPDGPRWWAVVLLVLGAASALYGILQASVASDLKRLLAYSTTENIGLILTAIGVWMTLRGAGQQEVADVALVAALLLVVSHAAFKTVLFLAAGSVLHATGERDLDRLGGLGARMPFTAATFGVAALGAAALPISSGFVAEWVLLQSLIHGEGRSDRMVAVSLPITVAVVALTAGLALLTFVKAFGIAFLARPRSEGAARAHESQVSMRLPLVIGAALVISLGLVPGWVAQAIAYAVSAGGIETVGFAGLSLPGVQALLDPIALLALALALAVPVVVTTAMAARRRPRREVDLPWGCGGVRTSPRMQYTATSYAEPLVRVFDDALAPSRDLRVTPAEESRYLVHRVEFRQRVVDQVEGRLYRPVVATLGRLGDAGRRVQNGNIHRYLAFSFAALLVVLLVVTW